MNQYTNKFVFAKKNIKLSGKILIEKDDVGIVESESKESASIFFIRIWRKATLKKNDFKIFDVKKTGDGFSKKICNICHKLRSTVEFAKNQNAKNNRSVRRPSCQKCRKQLEGVNISSAEKKKWLKSKPVNEPFECPICSKRTIAGITSKVVLEHNHHSGKVRGWVCDSCNTGIGRFKDDKKILKRAIKFI
ncbi:MAG: Hpy99I family type II restriction endonuclease [Candidatus Liptonbacteria bacterium]|nr:Hpy99I family type II restriction endonuclease [Parcubacteria group bacterium]MBI4085713.1 Hpy99I family type II restriction endonuclease [Candidatus Liptonbacteria bacterium]